MIESFSLLGREWIVWREDKLFGWIGSKARKFSGWREFFSRNPDKIPGIFGSLHSNYLASFCSLFSEMGRPAVVYAYTFDLEFRTQKSEIVRNRCKSLQIFPNKRELLFYLANRPQDQVSVLPEFGMHPNSVMGLFELHKQIHFWIQQMPVPTRLLVEIGSGVVYLSLQEMLRKNPNPLLEIQGILVAESKESWDQSLPERVLQLGFPEELLQTLSSCLPVWELPKSLRKQTYRFQSNYMSFFEKESELIPFPLEKVYSGKTFFYIHQYLDPTLLGGYRWMYLYQGGL